MEFKIRCSAISQIMTNPRSKTETLSETCKTHLEEWVKSDVYGQQKEIKSKYLTKGIEVEAAAIEYYSEVNNLGFLLPNTESFANDFMIGTPDLTLLNTVYDFKSSWDCFTFPLFDTEPDKGYVMQLQGYMHLTGKKKAKLVYTLQNTPEELVWGDLKDYSEIESKYRIKEFEIDYDPDFIESVYDRVIECRNYVCQLLEIIK